MSDPKDKPEEPVVYEVGDEVHCTVFHNTAMADGTFEPNFYSHVGEILTVRPDGKYEVWGPGGEQYQTVGPECLKMHRKRKPRSPK